MLHKVFVYVVHKVNCIELKVLKDIFNVVKATATVNPHVTC